jgi:hypothetical protein
MAGEKVDKERLTQVRRALRQLNTEHIPSCSAQGRDSTERLWGRSPKFCARARKQLIEQVVEAEFSAFLCSHADLKLPLPLLQVMKEHRLAAEVRRAAYI